jgi:hypothetical protein
MILDLHLKLININAKYADVIRVFGILIAGVMQSGLEADYSPR